MIAALLSQHISWDCVRDRKTYVIIFSVKGKHYKKHFLSKMRKLEIIKRLMVNLFLKLFFLQYFKKMKTGKINQKEIKIMKSVQEKCNLTFITDFISEKLPDIIFHKNHLKHYKNFHSDIYSFYDSCISIDADFAENLSVPVKLEPQSMHWKFKAPIYSLWKFKYQW